MTTPMDLEGIRERIEKARKAIGWRHYTDASAADVPALIAEVERLRAENARLNQIAEIWFNTALEERSARVDEVTRLRAAKALP